MNLVEMREVGKTYRRGSVFRSGLPLDALKNINFQIRQGGSVGLIGRSGSGKSTLCRLLLGLEKTSRGQVIYRGKDLAAFSKADWRSFRRRVQVVFQNALGSVNPRFTVQEIIIEPLLNYSTLTKGEKERKSAALLEQVGLRASEGTKLPHQVSGGELQRICIARALALGPEMIILDEAVSSLDMLIQSQILNLLKDLKRSFGVTYLFISHDLRIVSWFCDEILVLEEGRLVTRVRDLQEIEEDSGPALKELMASVLPPWPRQEGKGERHTGRIRRRDRRCCPDATL